MKHISNITKCLFVTALMLLTVSCESFLNTFDPSNVSTDYYDTKAGQKGLLTDIYYLYRSVYTSYNLQCLGTDMYLTCDESPLSVQFNGYGSELSGLSSEIAPYWSTLYKIIQECNILINRCSEATTGSDYAAYIAQGRFFRALAYYYLVETFGGVPLLTDENTDANKIIRQVTRESEANIYAFMIREVEESLDVLPAKTTSSHVSNTALQQFLGKLYLTRAYRTYAQAGDATTAAQLFESIITAGNYTLQTNFADVFNEDNQGNDEIIWAIQYGSDKNYNGSGNPIAAQYGFNITALYPGMFALDQSEYSAMQRNIWTNPVVHEWFRHPDEDARYEATFRFTFNINDASNADYGKVGIYMPKWNDLSGNTVGAKYYYPFKTDSGDYNWYPALGVMGWATDCMPMCQKFKETKIEWGGKGTREDVVMRLADTYLLCAEANLLDNDKAAAADKINALIDRAAGHDAAKYAVMKVSEGDITIDRILEERGCEMFGEHDRWFDLKRTGTLLTRALLNPLVVHYGTISEKNLVRPIPYSERIKLEGLDQNEGYKN